jgi:apolipoprotein N-acyltransferase
MNVEGSTTARPTGGYMLQPQAQEPETTHEGATRTVLAALLTGGLLWLSFFPVACGWLGWVALVPLLVLVRATGSARRTYLSAWLAGVTFFVPVLQWMRVADERMYYTWIALALYCSLYFPAAIGLLRCLDRRTRLPLVLTVPIVWTALEYLRAHLMTGFPWYFLSHTQHDFLPLIQIADLGGAYAVTFVIAAFNALVFEFLCRLRLFRRVFALPESNASGWPSLLGQVATVTVLLSGTFLYGFWRLEDSNFAPGPLVALIQSNLDQRIRNMAGGDESYRQMFEHNRQLTNYACSQEQKPELIVWPETSLPGEWHVSGDDNNVAQKGEPREVQSLIAMRWKTNVLLGIASRVKEADGKELSYNSAVLVRPNGEAVGRYDKMHRVPFGEYVPLQDWFPWMAKFAPYDYDYGVEPGKRATTFQIDPHDNFGVVICYEDTDPQLARQYVEGGAKANYLLNISNDGWFDGSAEHEQHLAICRFRAIECRRAMARAVNMGISVVIDGNGRVLQPDQGYLVKANGHDFIAWNWKGLEGTAPVESEVPVSRWYQFKKAAGVMLTRVPIDHRSSVYASLGDWLPQGCWLVLGLSMAFSYFRSRRGGRTA